MRWIIIPALTLVLVTGCQKPAAPKEPDVAAAPPAAAEEAGNVPVVARICLDGTRIYGPKPYAIWENDHWTNIEGSLARICEKK